MQRSKGGEPLVSFLKKPYGFCRLSSVNRYLSPPHPPYGREPLEGAPIASGRIRYGILLLAIEAGIDRTIGKVLLTV